MSSNGFVKLNRGRKTLELMKYPNAFALATTIALRARRTNNTLNEHGLELGEALVGDVTGRMTEQQYRTAKKQLSKFRIATFKPTNKGTIAKLLDNSIYDINLDGGNEQDNRQVTNKVTGSQRASNDQSPTNKKYKNGKNDKNKEFTCDVSFNQFWTAYPKKVGKGAARKAFLKLKVSEALLKEILDAVERQKTSDGWTRENGRYIPNPATWLNGERWLDEVDHVETVSEQVERMKKMGDL